MMGRAPNLRRESIMSVSSRLALNVLAASVLAMTAGAAALAQDNKPPNAPAMHRMQHWVVDHQALLDAKLAGLKAGLRLTPDQEKLWGPLEAAVRDAAQMRMEHMQDMMERMGQMGDMHREDMDSGEGETISPLDRLDAVANRMSQAGAALKKIADAGKPLYASLDDGQKRVFGFLAPELMAMGHGPGGMGPSGRRHHHGDEGGSDEE
jgi:hypothetical protein